MQPPAREPRRSARRKRGEENSYVLDVRDRTLRSEELDTTCREVPSGFNAGNENGAKEES